MQNQDFLSYGYSLAEFQSSSPDQIFKDASSYPQFFDKYLNDEDRVIKILQNASFINQRIFYYQYLKLCVEADEKDAGVLIQNIRDLIFNPDFYFLFDQDANQEIENDGQYKKLVFEFFEKIEEKEDSVFENFIKKYPIMDDVLVTMLRSLLIFYGKAASLGQQIEREIAFTTFQEIFGLQVQKFGTCIKFVDADFFVYQENDEEVYIAYIRMENQQQENSMVIQNQSHDESLEQELQQQLQTQELMHPESLTNIAKKKTQLYMSSTSSTYDFIDFTSPDYVKSRPDALDIIEKSSNSFMDKNSLENSGHIGRPFEQFTNKNNKKPMTGSSIAAQNQKEPQSITSLEEQFAPRLQQSIDMGYRIKQIKQRMIKEQNKQEKETVQKQESIEDDYKQLPKNISEATLMKTESKNSIQSETVLQMNSTEIPTDEDRGNRLQQPSYKFKTSNYEVYNLSSDIKTDFNTKPIYEKYNQTITTPLYQTNTKNQINDNLQEFMPIEKQQPFKVKKVSEPQKSYQHPFELSKDKEVIEKPLQLNNFNSTFQASKALQFQPIKDQRPTKVQQTFVMPLESNKKARPIVQVSRNQQPLRQGLQQKESYKPHQPVEVPKFLNDFHSVNADKSMNIIPLHKKIKINVTRQFSNSLVMQNLPQKQRKTIMDARERARAYRKSIQHLL